MKHTLRTIALAIPLALGLFPYAQSASALDLNYGSMKANKLLFLGNSITYSPAQTGIDWHGNWGMASTTAEKDFVHLVAAGVAEEAGGTPATMISNIAHDFEIGYCLSGYNVNTTLSSQLAFKADIAVVELGENVVSTLSNSGERAQFKYRFKELLTTLKNNGVADIFVTGGTIDQNKSIKDTVKQEVCATLSRCYYVDMSGFSLDPLNYAINERTMSQAAINAGVAGHPGDKGMAFIANGILASMTAHSVPEPGAAALLVIGAVCGIFVGFYRRMRAR